MDEKAVDGLKEMDCHKEYLLLCDSMWECGCFWQAGAAAIGGR